MKKTMSSSASLSNLRFTDLNEGNFHSFKVRISPEMIDAFGELSGDVNPLHMENDFAHEVGHPRRVVHGVLIASFFSRLVGVHLPGKHAFLQSINIRFLKPVYAGDELLIQGTVDQMSESTQTIVLKATASCTKTQNIHVRAKIQVGFTHGTRHSS